MRCFRTSSCATNMMAGVRKMELNFLQTYFGRNKEILAFARTLIDGGHRAAARELNRAISVLGDGTDAHMIIFRIKEKFFEQFTTTSAFEAAKRLSETHYVSD